MRAVIAINDKPAGPDPVGRAFAIMARAGRNNLGRALEQLHPGDKHTRSWLERAGIITKADQTVGSTGTSGWASQLTQTAVGEFVASLQPYSAGAQLIAAGIRVNLGARQHIKLPGRSGAPSTLAWVGEGSPIPVHNRTITAAQIGPPCKLAGIAVLTRELAKGANGEAMIGTILREDAGKSLDGSIFSTTAADSTRPAGLLYGLTALTPTASGDEGRKADLRALAAAIGTAGQVAFIASPELAVIQNMATDIRATVWPSAALAEGTVIAVDPQAFVSAFDLTPELEVVNDATVHMSDEPLEIVSGTGPATADPVTSLWQTDALGFRLILDAAWCMRASDCVAYMTGANWA